MQTSRKYATILIDERLIILCSFGICTLMYAGVAVMGYTMFGESTQSQFTLNLPQDLVATKIAVWTTVSGSNMFSFHYVLVLACWLSHWN